MKANKTRTYKYSRSKGVRRIILLISVLCSVGWVIFISILIGRDGNQNITPWIILLVSAIIVFFIPQLIRKLVYWIIDGFRDDETMKKNKHSP